MPAARLSILVPNFNNGRASSKAGGRDFIDDLFTSLRETLANDPTPLEIIVADDGSTDDSPATCRRWAGRTWRRGQPFCRLLEMPHCGVLSVVANRLTAEAAGELCCRLDGDVVMHTPDWAAALCRAFDDAPPGLGVVGAKQLAPDGRVHAAGDWVLHPRGYHHVAAGASPQEITRSMEVDHVMGCFYAHRRVVWEQLGGYDESIGRGQTVDFSLRARLKGWRIVSVPDIEFTHHHAQRHRRHNRGDTGAGITDSLARFREKWGFDRLAPDLDAVTRRWGRTPLAWNTAVFGPSALWPPPTDGPIEFNQSEWVRFTTDETFRHAVLWRAAVVEAVVADVGPRKRIGHLASRSGLVCHVLARRGLVCVGADVDANHLELARSVVAGKPYPRQAPVFVVQRDPDYRTLSFETGALDMLLLFDVIEHHRNPVGLYREANRVLQPGGVVVIVTRRNGREARQQLKVGALRPAPAGHGGGDGPHRTGRPPARAGGVDDRASIDGQGANRALTLHASGRQWALPGRIRSHRGDPPMKMKTLSVLAGASAPLILTAHASAGFVGLNVVSKPNDFGLIVCNVYVEFDRPGQDLMTSVAGTQHTPMLIQVLGGGTFFNSPFGDDQAPNSAFFPAFPTLEFDTFVTIGIKFTNPLDDALIIAPDFGVGITGTQLAFSNSAWAVTPVDRQGDPFDPDYVAGNGQVLIAQFATADGTGFSGTFLIGYLGNGVPGLQSVVSFFHVPTPGALALLGTAGLLGDRRRRRHQGSSSP